VFFRNSRRGETFLDTSLMAGPRKGIGDGGKS
jgi:hypothetical protein